MAHRDDLIATDIESYLTRHENKELLRFITCGSVDDGKSTLIGRLLHDSKMIFEDHMEAIVRDSKRNGSNSGDIDLALLVDGLQSEREQGITIDVAYRYFSTENRKFIIADTPGHEQYTRNMATGASTADLAIILIDASQGMQVQTRRHSFIVKLLGIQQVIVAINKMDVIDYSKSVFTKIEADYQSFAKELELADPIFVPISALRGDNVVSLSRNTPWYGGDSLMNLLDKIEIKSQADYAFFNFPVQYVNRPNRNFRGYAGTIASGNISVNDKVTIYPSGKTTRIDSIITYDGELKNASEGMAITLTLNDEVDVSRGDVIVKQDEQVNITSLLDVNIVWMNEEDLSIGKNYIIKRASTLTSGVFQQLHYKTNVNTLAHQAADSLALNEIAYATLALADPMVYLSYEQNLKMGSFIIIDRISNNTVGVGMIVKPAQNEIDQKSNNNAAFEIELKALIRKHFPT